jgi:hypothetical protein
MVGPLRHRLSCVSFYPSSLVAFPIWRSSSLCVGITTTTLYAYINGDGSVKEAGKAVLDGAATATRRTGADG